MQRKSKHFVKINKEKGRKEEFQYSLILKKLYSLKLELLKITDQQILNVRQEKPI